MALAVPEHLRCQHPSYSHRGFCKTQSIGEFDLPSDYAPKLNYVPNPPIILPARIRLCPAHKSKVDGWLVGIDLNTNSHEARCAACKCPNIKHVETLWIEWVIDTTEAVELLNDDSPDARISHHTWTKHVSYFGLLDKKAAKVNTKRALVIAAERGFGAGGHSVRTALIALQQLSKERGDVEEVKHTVTGVIGTVDLTKLSARELAAMAKKLALELDGGSASHNALPSGRIDDDGVININPNRATATKVR